MIISIKIIIKMTVIKVMAIMENADGEEYTYGGETGTPEFYMVKYTLQKYLGENIWVNNHEYDDTFIIEETDEGCNNLYDYNEIIKTIYENADRFNRKRRLKFVIINNDEN
jgi:hypothetical protein